MKQAWLKWSAKIDALTLRERVLVFGAVAATLVFASYSIFLNPLFGKQAALRAQIGQQRNNMAGIDAEIVQKMQAHALDPDAAGRARLAALTAETAQLDTSLRSMQQGLVAPERIAPLLETILKANGRLKLVSMSTLPVSSVTAATAAAATASTPASAAGLLYRHGVQVSVSGNYLDMVNYMSALETMPTQLFWGGAQLEVPAYPEAQLTLTLYTLSLDRKWMKL